uniref:WG repeat-containing protein n=1 Tax=Flavobacterium sp. TaxID=239 RepID=UPI00404A7049
MKNLLLFASILSFSFIFNSCSGDSSRALCNGDILIPFQEDIEKKWGFINLEGNIIIEPEFKTCPSPAINGIALIEDERNGERVYRFIKIEGDKAIESEDSWQEAGMFREGLAPVRNDNEKVSFIKEDYSIAFTVDAERVGYFNNGLAAFQNIDSKWGFINDEGKELERIKQEELKRIKQEETERIKQEELDFKCVSKNIPISVNISNVL